jgi:hypothetical protein
MPTEKIYKFTTAEAQVLDVVAQYTSKIRALFLGAHASVDAIITHEEIDAYPALSVLLDLTELSEFSTGLFDSLSQGFGNRAGVVAGEGELYLLENKSDGVTIQVIAADPLAEVAELSGPALFAHPQFPAYVDLAREKFTEVVNEFVAENPDVASPREISDTKRFITDFCDSAISAIKPIKGCAA